ncbi:Csu type fimbrial protein [Sphingomonas nostoxanthinifaciens]|uniref:Csu type fimbrial protein n=1 Tax=Sphingomonas nostoxanthinifaciens TaxID=2872652 RepID=UPI001CC1CEF6|nr:spore coat U domain-containing protein [Sphingomonas nostoxanthinifaciens]UAK22994.1 spore coat U domain-containing protein [Sphingomonas nostoxanthinifaciens]
MSRGILALAAMPAALAVPGAASAGTLGVRVEIQLQVTPGCSFSSGTSDVAIADATLSFGSATAEGDQPVDSSGASASGGSVLSVSCSNTYTHAAAPSVTVDSGMHGEGGQRYMTSPSGARIPYQLFQDQGRNIPYDPTTGMQLAIPTAGSAVPIPIYGRVTRTAGLPDGHYTDIVTLTLTY